jgi:glycosyltransferase involved in cell wall biosynthesis
MTARRKPVVVQHSFGDPGSGGPIGALERLLASPLAERYEFVRMHQAEPAGGINVPLIGRWAAQLRETRPDLVHVRGLGNEGFHGVLAARLAGCSRVLVSIHGTVRDLSRAGSGLRRRLLADGLEPATLRMATDIAAVCQAMEARDYLDPVRRKVRGHVPNGVDPLLLTTAEERERIRAELGLQPDDLALVVVGRLSLEKGHRHLARALERTGAGALKSVVLVLAGDGPDQDTIIDGYRNVPGLRLLPLGRRLDVDRILLGSDVFVFPTLHENLSNALLEAMAAGLPVVASAVGGNVEVLERGGGILVPAGDPVPLAAALERLIDKPGLRVELGEQAVDVVRRSYTLEHMVEGWDRMYQSILASGSRR